jgi:predicted deacetylase
VTELSQEPGALIVSLHDVAPPFESQIRSQLDTLAACGIRRVVLEVVPNWHGQHPIDDCPSLLGLLRAQVEVGSEIALHGLEHCPHGPLRGTVWSRFRGAIFAPNAAEFLSLSESETYGAALNGLGILEAAGLPRATTFCAPGWLMTIGARRAIARAGFLRIANMFSVDDLDRGGRDVMPSMGFMGGSAAQETGVRLLNAIVRVAAAPRVRAMQLYLHPEGGADSLALTRVLERAVEMVGSGEWRPTTYAEWYEHIGAEPRPSSGLCGHPGTE